MKESNGYIVETFKTEQAATNALDEFENGKRFVREKQDVWIVGNECVMESGLGGMQLGQAQCMDINQSNIVRWLTFDEFDTLMNELLISVEILPVYFKNSVQFYQ